MNDSNSLLVGDSFRVGYRFQRHWDTSMANAFFCGELGAGTFFVSMLNDFVFGMILGLLCTGVGKTYFHLAHMGVPQKSWRAILRPDRSWISRGLIGIVCFTGAGFLHMLNVAFDLEANLGVPAFLGGLVHVVAGVAALVVSTYQGFAMSHSKAIPLWSTAIMPVSSLLYAMTCGSIVALLFGAGADEPARAQLVNVALLLLLADTIILASLVHAGWHGSPGNRISIELLVKTMYSRWFWGCVAGAGLALPALMLYVGGANVMALTLATVGVLAGFYTFRVLMFKAGVYEPIMSFNPLFGRG